MHSRQDTVWRGFWSGGIWLLIFFENNDEDTVAINSVNFRTMLDDWFLAEIESEDMDNIKFQKDGVTCHTMHATIDIRRPIFKSAENVM